MLIELIRQAAAEVGEQPAIVSEHGVTTYEECLERAEALGRGLVSRDIAGFGCLIRNPSDLVALLAGASAVASEACVYPAATESSALGEVAARYDHAHVVVDDADRPAPPLITLDELARSEGELPPLPERAPVLILTTGTTGDQKGARHDWFRLARAVRRPDEEPGRRWLLAYNLNQFAGIQVLLHVLVSRATVVVPRSSRAKDVIAAMRQEQVTHVSGTPTFWRLLVGSLGDDEASGLGLEQITLGGEAAPDALLQRLRHLFPEARISHVYAGTEFGSAVAVGDGRAGLPLSVLDRDSGSDVAMRIQDGELQIRSRVGMIGYQRESPGKDDWRPTGDLVETRGDRIHFVGRKTDVINVGGAKVHPLPVEDAIGGVEGVALVKAYGRPNPITGNILVADVVPGPDADHEELERRIRAACEALPGPSQPRRINFVEGLEIKGNKLARPAAQPAE